MVAEGPGRCHRVIGSVILRHARDSDAEQFESFDLGGVVGASVEPAVDRVQSERVPRGRRDTASEDDPYVSFALAL